MSNSALKIRQTKEKLTLKFSGELTLFTLTTHEKEIDSQALIYPAEVEINLENLSYIDTAGALFLDKIYNYFLRSDNRVQIVTSDKETLDTLNLVKSKKYKAKEMKTKKERSVVESLGKYTHKHFLGFLSFMAFLGELFATKLHYLKSIKNIRFKEIAFEINESGVKAVGIIALTSFLIGLVVAYQSAYQLKIYGANIFIVDMLGISILRELSPLITAIVIAGRSGSAFTAQIGAMKITEELDAMRTMGFSPHKFLVIPRIIALMIVMPILIFISDISAIAGGMIVANLDLKITTELFIERFNEVVAAKHFFIGLIKGPFFAFLIATIGIYRGLMVKNDTQSIGFNTTKSVVESIFAVIVCDAIFSIMFTNLGI
ncbi:MAG: MlaE family lipid ABC transporter permease subunit [Campylobacterota bacterium]|nr:MlaE family lipid ABC transporter permease subunit [Campylobacterota bacterium]